MNTAMDKQGGVSTARPLEDLTNYGAGHGLLNVIVVSDDDGVHNRGRHSYEASRTTTTNENSSSAAHPGRTNHEEQLTTTTSMMLTNMSAATNPRRRAASGSNDDSVHEDLVIYIATYHKIPRLVRPRLPTDTTTMEATRKLTSLVARSGTANNQQMAELMNNIPPCTAYYRHIADSIDGSGGADMDPMMPKKRRTMAYGATTHGMNEASADECHERGQIQDKTMASCL